MQGRRVAIIGGGAMGLTTAYHVADDEFILGPVPAADEMFAGAGEWRGAGDKFAPRMGRVLAQLALQQSAGYDIRRFAPARFTGGREAGGLKTGGAVS